MKLEEIKGMNIPIGSPIEVKLRYKSKGLTRKDLGYFQGFNSHRLRGGREIEQIIIPYHIQKDAKNEVLFSYSDTRDIENIQSIKILEYKKDK